MKDLSTVYTEYETNYSEPNVRSKGREDGAHGVPAVDSPGMSPYELELLSAAKLVASRVVGHYRGKMEQVDARIKALRTEAADRLKGEETRLTETYAAQKARHDQSFELRSARDAVEQAKKRFDVMFGRIGRMPLKYVPHWLYILFASLIFLGEIPLNAMVFQIFGENQVMTWVMAFVIGLSIPLSAHFIGIKAREHHPTIHWANVVKASVVAALLVYALHGLSTMRHDYLLAMKDELGLSAELIETSYLFFWLNVSVFCAAIILAYLSHDPVAGYGETEVAFRNAQKRLKAQESKVATALNWLEGNRAGQMEAARGAYRTALAECTKLEGEYDQLLLEGREQEARSAHMMMKDIAIYRQENLRARKEPKSPLSFANEISFPMVLAGLKEKLNNEAQ